MISIELFFADETSVGSPMQLNVAHTHLPTTYTYTTLSSINTDSDVSQATSPPSTPNSLHITYWYTTERRLPPWLLYK